MITITGLQLGAIIAFAIITETVFQWPGMGLLFIQAVSFADIPVMAAYLCFIALVFVLINLIVDLLYYAVDPRLRIERLAACAMSRTESQHRPLTAHEPVDYVRDARRADRAAARPARASGARLRGASHRRVVARELDAPRRRASRRHRQDRRRRR